MQDVAEPHLIEYCEYNEYDKVEQDKSNDCTIQKLLNIIVQYLELGIGISGLFESFIQ